MRNVLLTGLPRSGTTLLCHLLNKLPDTVALHEPLSPRQLMAVGETDMLAAIQQFCADQRKQVREDGTAISKAKDGQVPSNPLADDVVDGQRVNQLTGKLIRVSNVRSDNFSLYIKHPAFFTGYLPKLVSTFECYSTVRNPLALLLSWRNAQMPVTHGRAPNAELAAPALASALEREKDVLNRQLILLDFFCERYATHLQGKVLRYEEVVDSRGKILERLEPKAADLNESLGSRNARYIHSDPAARRIADKLLASNNACWQFYQRADVEALLQPVIP